MLSSNLQISTVITIVHEDKLTYIVSGEHGVTGRERAFYEGE